MYLSRVMLNTALRETMKALVSPSLFHGAIENSFDGDRERRLWRLDDLNAKKYVLILSETVPDLKGFAEQFGCAGEYETKDYSPLLDRISEGGTWQFRLTANPVISKSHGKIMAHITPGFQKKWLKSRAEKLGFSLNENEFEAMRSKWYDFHKKNGSGSSRIRFLSVTFEGILTVKDVEQFKETLCSGIGREKAYGQGLLTIVRGKNAE
ncbi:MAG: type I-E CRISPR-associated protein Cas6/Cse3/CasE [Lachnospiraceae bacterium]|nr:type I-E CRISPR-associated protein Cas6/Cse3/CasE [Lachnospiraceae bacterium]